MVSSIANNCTVYRWYPNLDILPLWVRVDQGVMAMKVHNTFPKAL